MSKNRYQRGFASYYSTEAEPGALPERQNSPQRAPLGLYAEKFSASAFTAPRADNLRSWFYRIRPSVVQGDFEPIAVPGWESPASSLPPTPPAALRWDPLAFSDDQHDFIDGVTTIAVNGDPFSQCGIGIHIYRLRRSMERRYFYNGDGELLFVPEHGALSIATECGALEIEPGHIAAIPKGIKFRVDLRDERARGYLLENYGAPLRLPERGPIGTDGLANDRDFEIPVAAYEDRDEPVELVTKLGGCFYRATVDHSPLDVVAWHGRLAPYRYWLDDFNTIGSISYDHPDPSIFTVLTSPSDTPGVANVDFVIFPPRWLVMEDTFRPPWYHRNVMSEYMGLIHGEYDAKPGGGFVPGGGSLHNAMTPHGPDAEAFEVASSQPLEPQKLADTLAFMFESRYLIRPTDFALSTPHLQSDYAACWQGLERRFRR